MPKLPRNLSQDRALRAFLRAGGVEIPRRGKGSHRAVLCRTSPGGLAGNPEGGLLAAQIKEAEISVEEFLDLL